VGEPAARIAAAEIALNHLLNDQPENTVLPLETGLILNQEPVEMIKNHPVKDHLLRTSRTIDSRHSGRMASRNGPTHGDDRRLGQEAGEEKYICGCRGL
jgi:hypothetical protein